MIVCDWQEEDDPIAEHSKHRPACSLAQQYQKAKQEQEAKEEQERRITNRSFV